ncbi:MAG: 7-cyano-7-deazaguanine synthase QueC [Pseudomonadota bacterium]
MTLDRTSALVLFSGGQDSTVCLAWALETYETVETIGFDYGQRHDIELSCRQNVLTALDQTFPQWAEKRGADHVLKLETLGQVSDTALTGDAEITMTDAGLPNTFVPGRNLLFFTYAAALGYRRSLFDLVGGMCETDYSGYPDCRETTLKALEQAISLGTEAQFQIITPLMHIDKAATWAMAHKLGGHALVKLIIEHTHTCYLGKRDKKHPWGFGCGHCPACTLRAKGYHTWQQQIQAQQ